MALNQLRARLARITPRKWITIGVLFAFGVALFFVNMAQNPNDIDWHFTYRPAAIAMVQGKSPFTEVRLFFTSPWALIPIIPFAVLPEAVGRSLWFVVCIGLFAFVAYKLGGKPIAVMAFLLSAPVANSIAFGNIDAMVLLGFILPPQIGLIFLGMKPQSTFVAMVYYVVEAWRTGGVTSALRTVWPVALVGVLSLLVYGLWPLKAGQIFDAAGIFNISIWPQGIPIGLLLALKAFRDRKAQPAIMASPFLSPYTILPTWSSTVAAFVNSTVEMVTVSIGSWIFWIIYRLTVG